MKFNIRTALIIGGLLGLTLTGCASGIFSGTTPPTPAQRAVFNVTTNEEPVVITQTNVVTEVNVVTVTNTQNQVVTQTNVVPVTQVITSTNVISVYSYAPNGTATTAAQTAGLITNAVAPGWGTVVTTGIMAVLGLGGWLFSYKKGNQQGTAASAMAQEIEAMLEFVNTLPSGTAYATAIQNWLSQHQVQTGAATTILQILEADVDNPTAKAAAATIIASLQATASATVPPAPKATPTT